MGKGKALDQGSSMGAVLDKLEQLKASIGAKMGNPFSVIKTRLWHVKVRYSGPAKNTTQLQTPYALSTLGRVRRTLLREALE